MKAGFIVSLCCRDNVIVSRGQTQGMYEILSDFWSSGCTTLKVLVFVVEVTPQTGDFIYGTAAGVFGGRRCRIRILVESDTFLCEGGGCCDWIIRLTKPVGCILGWKRRTPLCPLVEAPVSSSCVIFVSCRLHALVFSCRIIGASELWDT